MKRQTIITIILMGLSIFIVHAFVGQSNEAKIYSKGGKGIYKQTPDGKEVTIYETSKDVIGFRGFHLSPCGRYIAVIETTRGFTPEGKHDFEVLPKNSMVIIDTSGSVLYSLDEDVRKIVWSPDGNKIAYITGEYREGGVGFRTTGIYVFDLTDGSRKEITKDFEYDTLRGYHGGGYNLNWAVHDSNLYIAEFDRFGGNYMYDPKTGKTRQVSYKGIHFSPDGRYYLELRPEDSPHLYVSATNEDLTEIAERELLRMPYSWISDRPHHLSGVRTKKVLKSGEPLQHNRAYLNEEVKILEKTFLVYDVEKREVVEQWTEKYDE